MQSNVTIEAYAKISHHSSTIGLGDDVGRRWLCPDSTSKHSSGNDSSGSSSHNSESRHYGEGSGQENGDSDGSKGCGGCSADHAEAKVQLCLGNEYWCGPRRQLKSSRLSSTGTCVPGLKDSLNGAKTQLTQEEAQAVLTEVQNEVKKQQQEKTQQAAARIRLRAKPFGGQQSEKAT